MKKFSFLLIAVLVLVLSFGQAFAATYKHADAKVEFSVPDSWKVTPADGVFTIEAKGETEADNISMQFEAIKAEDITKTMDEAEKEIAKWLEAQFGKEKSVLKEEGKLAELKINGMDAISQLFTCNDGKFAVEITIIVTPANKFMALYYYASVEAEKKHSKEIGEIVNSIKPLAEAEGFEKK